MLDTGQAQCVRARTHTLSFCRVYASHSAVAQVLKLGFQTSYAVIYLKAFLMFICQNLRQFIVFFNSWTFLKFFAFRQSKFIKQQTHKVFVSMRGMQNKYLR